MDPDDAISERLDRMESRQDLLDLQVRYALAVDARDLDALSSLFVPDVHAGKFGSGRESLRHFFDEVLRRFYRSVHLLCGQSVLIDPHDRDRATGKAYCRAEHEASDGWYVMAILYSDTFERRDGSWYFLRRRERHWYTTDAESRPSGPTFQGWPGLELPGPTLPQDFPTWSDYWSRSSPAEIQQLTRWP